MDCFAYYFIQFFVFQRIINFLVGNDIWLTFHIYYFIYWYEKKQENNKFGRVGVVKELNLGLFLRKNEFFDSFGFIVLIGVENDESD